MPRQKSGRFRTLDKKIIVGVLVGVLLVLNLIPFTYTKAITCRDGSMHQEQGIKLGLPFQYWSKVSNPAEVCPEQGTGGVSEAGLFWDLAILGLLTVAIGALVNPQGNKRE